MKSGYSKKTVQENIALLVAEGAPKKVAIARALDSGRAAYRKKHPNGMLPYHLRLPEDKARTNQKYGKNPVPPSSHAIATAKELYERFTGHPGEEIGFIDVPAMPKTVVAIGQIDGILYTTVRDGKTEKYIHKFSRKARPLFAVSPDGQQLFILGGEYDFTERGIVDRV